MAAAEKKRKNKSVAKPKAAGDPLLHSEVASFASSIGLAVPTNSSSLSGFNDADFRKTGLIKPTPLKNPNPRTPKESPSSWKPDDSKKKKWKNNGFTNPRAPAAKNFSKEPKSRYFANRENARFNGKMQGKLNSINDVKLPLEGGKEKKKFPLAKASELSRYWYEDTAALESRFFGAKGKNASKVKDKKEWDLLVEKKIQVAQQLMDQFVADYESTKGKSSDIRMALTAQKTGTAVHKVSACMVLVQDNPIANFRSLDTLLAMVTSKVGKRHAVSGFDTLSELFLRSLLPDRKLNPLFEQPIDQLVDSRDGYSLLLYWYWEDSLKKRFEHFVVALESASRDVLEVLKKKSLKIMHGFLIAKQEQDRRLLSACVNKFGDPEGKVASDAAYLLTCLLSTRPDMKLAVLEEVDFFIFRPHLGLRAKCHAINFLNQIVLSSKGEGPKVAKRLVDIYFAIFKVVMSEVDSNMKDDLLPKKVHKPSKASNNKSSSSPVVELDSRLLSGLLIGLNRAFPFLLSEVADAVVESQSPMLFRLAHSKNFNICVQAMMLLFQILARNQAVSDRFYRALYTSLLVPTVMKSSSTERFLALLLQAMKSDVNMKRVYAFAKRILQVAIHQQPQHACGCLVLLSEVLKVKPILWSMYLQEESGDDGLEHFEDVVEDSDHGLDNSAVVVKDQTEIVPSTVDSGAIDASPDDSSEEESEVPPDLSEDDSYFSEDMDLFKPKKKINPSGDAGNFELVSNTETESSHNPKVRLSAPGGYDIWHREPSFCNADRSGWWELAVLAAHVHPSVATMARTLLSGAAIVYYGEPIHDLSLSAFLDKFVEKKPKRSWRAGGQWHGGSDIAPSKKLEPGKQLVGPEILSLAEEDVPPEDLVFHKFYMIKTSSGKKKAKKRKKQQTEDEEAEELLGVVEGDDDVEGGDESDNEEIDNLLDTGLKNAESDGEYDYDKLDNAIEDDDELDREESGDDTDIPGGIDHGTDSEDNEFDEDSDHDTQRRRADKDKRKSSSSNRGVDVDVDIEDDMPLEMEDMSDDNSMGSDDVRVKGASSAKKKSRKSSKRSGISPFASIEEYDHLLRDDDANELVSRSRKKRKR